MARRPPRLPAVVMALGVLFFLGYVFLLRPPPELPVPDLEAVRGTYSWAAGQGPAGAQEVVARGEFDAVASGDAAGTASAETGAVQSVYAADGRRQSDCTVTDGERRCETTIGVWPPAWRLATHGPLDYQGLAAVVRSAVADGDRAVGTKVVSDDGRRAWRAAMTFAGADLVELVVDQESGLVTWFSETTPEDSATFTFAADWADPPAADEAYEPPGGVAPGGETVVDGAYAYVPTLVAAREPAGWGPLGSELAPDGFRQRAVATAAAGLGLADHLADGFVDGPPVAPDEELVAQMYARGLTWFTVEQYGPEATRFYEDALGSLLDDAAAAKLSFEREELQYGWFEGLDAYTWYEKSGPTLFVAGRHRMVYITGALTRDELVSFAQGLEPLE